MIGKHLDTRGFLSFLILWLLKDKKLSGKQLRDELARRKGVKPNPGTIYPALKTLLLGGLIEVENSKRFRVYRLSEKGACELAVGCTVLQRLFPDFSEISNYSISKKEEKRLEKAME